MPAHDRARKVGASRIFILGFAVALVWRSPLVVALVSSWQHLRAIHAQVSTLGCRIRYCSIRRLLALLLLLSLVTFAICDTAADFFLEPVRPDCSRDTAGGYVILLLVTDWSCNMAPSYVYGDGRSRAFMGMRKILREVMADRFKCGPSITYALPRWGSGIT